MYIDDEMFDIGMKFFLENTLEQSLPEILDSLTHIGATSIPILRADARQQLVHTAQNLSYQQEAEEVGKDNRLVRQQVASCEDFSQAPIFLELQEAFQELLDQSFKNFSVYPFSYPINLNRMVLQKYEPGSLGITPHRDGKRYKNLVCVFVLEGQGKFYVCSDRRSAPAPEEHRAGNNAIEIDASVGNVLLMRASGFKGINNCLAQNEEIRPFHFITDIQTQRYTFALRQEVS
jgi:hypothetical protein